MKAKSKKQPVKKTRKEQRKEQRQQKKARKHDYYTNRNKPGKFVKLPKNNNEEEKEHVVVKSTQPKAALPVVDQRIKQIKKEKKEQQHLQKQMNKQRNKQLVEANEEEDRNIKRLEKQLKLNKRKTKSVPKSFAVDGLDYLLEVCDSENMKGVTDHNIAEVNDEFEEDFALMTGGSLKKSKGKLENKDMSNFSDDNISENSNDELAIDDSDEESEEDYSDAEIPVNNRKKGSDKYSETRKNKDEGLDTENESSDDSFPGIKISKNSLKATKRSNDHTLTKASKKIKLDLSNSDEDDGQDNCDEDDDNSGSSEEDLPDEDKQEETWEDIYGRVRSKTGSVINGNNEGKYIPPAIRAKINGEFPEDKQRIEKLNRLKKLLKGLLNRLAAANMHSISTQIEDLYMNNSRNDMNDTLTTLILDALVSRVLAPERLLLEHIALITILHANVGSEVGAHFLQTVVKNFDKLFKGEQPVEDKNLDNTVNVIAHLYNFKVFHSQLIYQILGKLSERFDEKCVECVLHILKGVGFSLRKDDPLTLKTLILDLQKQAAIATEKDIDNSRVKFMLDILLAIKNNNMSKIPNYDTSYSEHLKKMLRSFVRKGNYVTQLNISLEDLLKAEERGKWWVVGSAWTGNIENANKPGEKAALSETYSEKLLHLAKKHRMNTDTRRNIFCIIMSAEDYLDAFEKLLHLGLKNQQEREIIHVILHCCLQEKTYNPYYGILSQKFCDYDRKFQMAIKCSVWDKLKNLTECSASYLSNLAKLLTNLFLEKGLPISTLKIVQFGELDKITLRFMRQILLGILLHDDLEACLGVFEKVAQSEKLKMFRESLRLFIHHFLLKNLQSDVVPNDQRNLLEERAKMIEKILTVSDKKTRF